MKQYLGLLTLFLGITGISPEIHGFSFDKDSMPAIEVGIGINLINIASVFLWSSSSYFLEKYHISKNLLTQKNLLSIVNLIRGNNKGGEKIVSDYLSSEDAHTLKDEYNKERAASVVSMRQKLAEGIAKILGSIEAWKIEEPAVKDGQEPFFEVTLLRKKNNLPWPIIGVGLSILAAGLGLTGHGFYKSLTGEKSSVPVVLYGLMMLYIFSK